MDHGNPHFKRPRMQKRQAALGRSCLALGEGKWQWEMMGFPQKRWKTPLKVLRKPMEIAGPMQNLKELPMDIHEFPTEVLWVSIEILWKSYGNPMEIQWKSYGNPMEIQWKLWEFYGNRWNSSLESMA